MGVVEVIYRDGSSLVVIVPEDITLLDFNKLVRPMRGSPIRGFRIMKSS